MSHWAQVDENNIVVQVLVGNDNHPDEGYQWFVDNIGGTWIKTSYNSRGGIHYTQQLNDNGEFTPSGKQHLRYNYAGIGYSYDSVRDAFIPPKPATGNWTLNESTCLWEEVTE
jgi:hypothetical protein